MIILLIAFLAWILSVLAPCVLPVIPVIFGGWLSDGRNAKTIRILLSAMICIFIFTFLLKVSTVFIAIPTSVWSIISGVIILFYGLTLVFPYYRELIQIKIPQITLRQTGGKRWDYILGASLGPVFASCSPTYALLIGTILPVSLVTGVSWIMSYLLWFGGFLYLLVWGWRSLITKFYGRADTRGRFKRILWIILIFTALLLVSGLMKKTEALLVNEFPSSLESLILNALHLSDGEQQAPINGLSWTNALDHYKVYDPNSIPTTWDIVLFFHAAWCPTCVEAENNFLASNFSPWLTILKVDFDTATDLKIKYNILAQTSFAYIKPDGTLIKRWIGWLTLQDVLDKIAEAKSSSGAVDQLSRHTLSSWSIAATAYFAGGCFWCMEGPFEALDGVIDVVDGYQWDVSALAHYDIVSTGKTKHRETIKVVYDPSVISYAQLIDAYRRQINPTDSGGQFADRGYQYTPAIVYQTPEERKVAEQSKQALAQSKKFNLPIVVSIIPFSPFYPAEEYHQDYYKKHSESFLEYEKASGREDFVQKTRAPIAVPVQKENNLAKLTPEQRNILFSWGTEPPFHNAYWNFHGTGIYVDVIDGTPLFSSLDKFDSGTGWPSFTRPIDDALVASRADTSLGMDRTEIISASSSGHLGHVFDDGPVSQGGKRYCINSAALRFVPLADMKKEGYEKYLVLFGGK